MWSSATQYKVSIRRLRLGLAKGMPSDGLASRLNAWFPRQWQELQAAFNQEWQALASCIFRSMDKTSFVHCLLCEW